MLMFTDNFIIMLYLVSFVFFSCLALWCFFYIFNYDSTNGKYNVDNMVSNGYHVMRQCYPLVCSYALLISLFVLKSQRMSSCLHDMFVSSKIIS